MTSNHTPCDPSLASGHGRPEDVAANTVLVADSDPAVTDRIASHLRGRYAVRAAYTGEEALDSIDADVSVVLFDPTLPEVSTEQVVARIADAAVDCRLAAVVDETPSAPGAFDDFLLKPVAPEALRSTVDRLCRQAAYRNKLERYYDLVTERASADGPDERERLDDAVARLRDELDQALTGLDQRDAYYAALRELDAD